MINETNISKLSFAEAMSNSNGKTAGSKLGSFIALCTGCICFIMNSIALFIVDKDIAQSVVIMGSASAGVILGSIGGFAYSKKKATKDTTNSESLSEI